MKNLVILSGSGLSAESGIETFRGANGLWEKYDITKLANPEAWRTNRELVLRFYNERRKKIIEAEPNSAHKILAELEKYFKVIIVTQNVDDFHERAGSTNILHLHGEIRKSRSTKNPALIYQINGWELNSGDKCELGSQLRPHIVWFGEPVTKIEEAAQIVSKADIFIVIGTSLKVYPAAGLLTYTRTGIPKYLIDPEYVDHHGDFQHIKEKASIGLEFLKKTLIANC